MTSTGGSPFYVPSYLDPSTGTVDFQKFADTMAPNGPLRFRDCSGAYQVTKSDLKWVLKFTATGQVDVPVDPEIPRERIPDGSEIAILNYGTGRVVIKPGAGVTIGGDDRLVVNPMRVGVLVKQSANFWLLSLGNGTGGDTKNVPLPPENVKAFGTPGGAVVTWDQPKDDGGLAITAYVVQEKQGTEFVDVKTTSGSDRSAQISDLKVGTKYTFRVKAANPTGFSDPSAESTATPTAEYNAAKGGSESVYSLNGKNYKVHVFLNSGDFEVTKAPNPFDVLILGGGAEGGARGDGSGGGGAGGFWEKIGQVLNTTKYAVTVGGPAAASSIAGIQTVPGGGAGSSRDSNHGGASGASGGGGNSGSNGEPGGGGTAPYGNGGGSSRYSQSAAMGGGGGGAGGAGEPQVNEFGGGSGGAGRNSDIPTGAPVMYCKGGNASGRDRPNGGAAVNYGDGGGGGGNPGKAGMVAIRYEIAPFNDAEGGTVKDVPNYNGTGETWRTHTFTANDTLKVKAAFDKFRVLVCAGGGGGGGHAGNVAQGIIGGSGGAGGAFEDTIMLGVDDYPVVVGNGGGGGFNARGGQGGNSSIFKSVATGGGGGGCQYQGAGGDENGGNGGSGGGGQCASQFGARGGGGSGIAGQGTNGNGGGEQGQGPAAGGGRYLQTNITGTAMTVAPGAYGNGGAGRGWDSAGNAGGPGVVIVAYRIK